MLSNADITIYNCYGKGTRSESWQRTQIKGVEWYGGQAVTVTDSGLQSASTYTVRIPAYREPAGKTFSMPADYKAAADPSGLWTLQNGDIIVRGLVDDDATGSTAITGKYADRCFTVTGWRDNRRGSAWVQHWRVDGK